MVAEIFSGIFFGRGYCLMAIWLNAETRARDLGYLPPHRAQCQRCHNNDFGNDSIYAYFLDRNKMTQAGVSISMWLGLMTHYFLIS